MKQQEIIEGNKLIAEFMGRKFKAYKENSSYNKEFDTYNDCLQWIEENKLQGYKPELGWELECGKFNNDWNWLMPVVEKIEAMQNRDIDARITIKRNTCNIYFDNGVCQYEFNTSEGSKLETTYKHIVHFIGWYNSQPVSDK